MKLIPFEEDDFERIFSFMQPIWLETYESVLPKEQIEFLLEKYFSKSALQAFVKNGYRYFKIDEVGVLVYVEREKEVYLDKLYLLPSARGKGYAEFVFAQLLNLEKDILLKVNRANARAVGCYLKNGFEIEKKEEILLGNGMINYDYVMRKRK